MNKVDQGINAYLSGDVNSCIKLLESYLEAGNSPDGQLYYYLGLSYNELGKTERAGELFKKALEFEPDKGMYSYQLGLVYAELMLFQQAVPLLLKTIEQNPQHVRAHLILGGIYFKNGELDDAISQFETVTKMSPNFSNGFYSLANSLYYKGDIQNAKANFIIATAINDNSDAYYKLALISINEGLIDEAQDYIDKAIENGFANMMELSQFAIFIANAGAKELAITFLEKMDKLFDGSKEIKNALDIINK